MILLLVDGGSFVIIWFNFVSWLGGNHGLSFQACGSAWGLCFFSCKLFTVKFSESQESKSIKDKDGKWNDSSIFVNSNEIENLKKVIAVASDFFAKLDTDFVNNAINKSKQTSDTSAKTEMDNLPF